MAKGRKTGGRRKGSLNKHTADLKGMVEGALADVGGRQYLATQAVECPAAFLALLGKLVPRDLNVALDIALSERMRQLLGKGE